MNNPDIQMKYRPKRIYPAGNSPKNISSKVNHQKKFSDYQMVSPNPRDNEKIIHHSIKRNFDPEGNAIITTKIVREIDYNDNKNNINSDSIMNIRPKAMNASFQRNNEQENKIFRYSNYSNNEEIDNSNGIYNSQNYGYPSFSPESYESHENNYTKINTYSGREMESDGGREFHSEYRSPGTGNILNMKRSEINQGMPNYTSGSDFEETGPRSIRQNGSKYISNQRNINYNQKMGLNKVKYRRYNLESPSYTQNDDFDSPDRNYDYNNTPYFRNVQIDKIKGIQPIYQEKVNMMNNQIETSGEYEQIINKSRQNYGKTNRYTPGYYRQAPEDIEDTIDIINEKATQIQSYVRGFLVRKKVLRYITLAIYYQSFCDKIQDALCCHVREEVFNILKNKLRNKKYNKRGSKDNYSTNSKRKNHISTRDEDSIERNNYRNRNGTKEYEEYNRIVEKREYRGFKHNTNTPQKSVREYENYSYNRNNRENGFNKNICKKNNLNYSVNYSNTEYKKLDYTVSPTKKVTHYYISSPCSHNKPHNRYYQEIDGKISGTYRNKLNTYNSHKNINELRNYKNYEDYNKYKYENYTSKMSQEKPDYKSGIGTRSYSRGLFKTTYSSSNQNVHKCHCLDGIRKQRENIYRENTENNYNVRRDVHIIKNYDIKRDINTHRLIRRQEERNFNRFKDEEIESDNYLSLNIVKIPHRRVSSTDKKEEIITKTVESKEYAEDNKKKVEEPEKRRRFSKIEVNKGETVRFMPIKKKEEISKSVSTRDIFTSTVTEPHIVSQAETINIKGKKKEIVKPKIDKEKERRDKERMEKEIERRVKERVEVEKQEIERIDKERKDKERKDRLEREKRDREKEKKEKEKRDQEEQLLIEREKQIQIEQEKIIRERKDMERREKEAQRRREKEEKERKDREEQERLEREKREKDEQNRRDREKKERERRDKMDRERREREKKEMEEQLIIEREKIIKEETERLEKEMRERERKEREARLKREREEKQRREKEEKERLERERQLEEERKEKERQLEEERKERERKEKERRDKIERERRERERKEREEQLRIEREKKRKEEQDRIEREKKEKERKEREEKLRIEREERIRKEKLERERIEREKERERQEKERKEKLEKEKKEREIKIKIEKERIERERREKERKEKEAQMKKEKEAPKIKVEKTPVIDKDRAKRLEQYEKERKERVEKRLKDKEKQPVRNIVITTKTTTTTQSKKDTDNTKIQTVKVKEQGGGKYPSFGPNGEYILKKDCQKNLNEMKLKLEKEYEQKIEMEKRRGQEELRMNQENMEKKNKKEIERIMEMHKQKDEERLREIEREKEIIKKRELELEKLKEKEVKMGVQIETEKQRELQRQKEIEERNKKAKMIRMNKEIEINLKNAELGNEKQYTWTKKSSRDREKDILRAKEIIRIFILSRCDPLMKRRKYFNVWRRKARYLELLEYSKVIQEFCRANLEMTTIKRSIKNWKNLSKKLFYKARVKLLKMRPKVSRVSKVNLKRKKLYELLRITKLITIFSRRRFIHFIILIWHIYAKNIHKKRVNMKYLYENLLKTYMSLANDIFGNNQMENPSVQDAMYEAVNTNKFITLYPDDVPLARKHYEEMRKIKSVDSKDRGIYQGSIVKSATTTKLEIEKKEIKKQTYMTKINEKEENNSESDEERRRNEKRRRKLDFLAKYRKHKLYDQDSAEKKHNYSYNAEYSNYDKSSTDTKKNIKNIETENKVDSKEGKSLYKPKNFYNRYNNKEDKPVEKKSDYDTNYIIKKYVKTEGNDEEKNETKTVEKESTYKYGNFKNRNKSEYKEDKKPIITEKNHEGNHKTFGNKVNVIYSSNLQQETITSNKSDKSNTSNSYQKKFVSNIGSQKDDKEPKNYNINIKKETIITKPKEYDTYQKKVYVKTTTEEPKTYSKKIEIKTTTTTTTTGNAKTTNYTYNKDENYKNKYGSRENIRDDKKEEAKPELHKSNTESKLHFVYKSKHFNTVDKNEGGKDSGKKVETQYEKKVEIKPYKMSSDNNQETKKVVLTKSYKSRRYSNNK